VRFEIRICPTLEPTTRDLGLCADNGSGRPLNRVIRNKTAFCFVKELLAKPPLTNGTKIVEHLVSLEQSSPKNKLYNKSLIQIIDIIHKKFHKSS
jgi:hypothetical protein